MARRLAVNLQMVITDTIEIEDQAANVVGDVGRNALDFLARPSVIALAWRDDVVDQREEQELAPRDGAGANGAVRAVGPGQKPDVAGLFAAFSPVLGIWDGMPQSLESPFAPICSDLRAPYKFR